MARLSVELTADIKRLESQLNRAKKQLASLEGVGVKSNNRLGQSFNTAGKGAANAVPTLQEFSRVIQDAPFGIQGVANNIQQLTANFGNLSRSAGGGRAALKLLIGALSGPGGILLAVSAVTALLVSFGDELFKSSKKADNLQKKIEGLNETFESELRISKSIEESLELQGKSTTGILNSRKELISNQLTGLANLINEQKQLLEIQRLENARVDNLELITGFFGKLFKTAAAFASVLANNLFDDILKSAEELLNIEIDRSQFASASAEDKEKERQLTVQLNNLLAQQKELQNDILKINKDQASAIRENILAASTGLSQGFAQTGSNGIFAPLLTSLNQLPLKFQTTSQAIVNISQGLSQGLSSAFANIGQTLAQGGNLFGAVGQAILQTLGAILSQVGQGIIQAGVAALALKNLFLKPGAAIAAGGLLVAIGSALGSAQAAVGSIGTGSVGGQGSGSFSGSNSSFSSAVSSSGGGTVVFEIAYEKLRGVLDQGDRNRGRVR